MGTLSHQGERNIKQIQKESRKPSLKDTRRGKEVLLRKRQTGTNIQIIIVT